MKFATRIIIITGLSTLLLTSLYWLASWHLVEAAEDANRDTVLTIWHRNRTPPLRNWNIWNNC